MGSQSSKHSRKGSNTVKKSFFKPSKSRSSASPSVNSAPVLNQAQSSSPPSSRTTTSATNGQPALSTVPGSNTALISAAASPRPTSLGKPKEIGSDVWTGLKLVLNVLKETADVFPPLKAVVGGFLACTDVLERAAANRENYGELADHLDEISDNLEKHMMLMGLEESGSIKKAILSIRSQVSLITKKREHGTARRIIESSKDEAAILACYREIEMLFQQLHNDIELRTFLNTKGQLVIDHLKHLSPVDAARYNSFYSQEIKRGCCTPETRAQILLNLQDWAKNPDAEKIYWMNGMAGTGKTTIAYSFCEWLELEENKLLGATFFCSRATPECRSLKGILPTIAYQLSHSSPEYRAALYSILKDDPDAGSLNLQQQFTRLVINPLAKVQSATRSHWVVVIDALDECESTDGVQQLLTLLLRYAADLPLKFFVTSRPEPAINDAMQLFPQAGSLPSILHLHDIEKSLVEGDIMKYMIHAFKLISHFLRPTPAQIEQLARRAGNFFIYAATIIRYISSSSSYATKRFQAMLDATSQSSGGKAPSVMHEELDQLYSAILAAALTDPKVKLESDEIEERKLVLWTAVCAIEPMTLTTASSILGLTKSQLSAALEPWGSVLHVSNEVISTLHASFPDYLLDPERSGKFCCNQPNHNELLTRRCFDVMKKELRFNICGLESSFVYDKDVPEFEERVKQKITSQLFYACRYWGEHLNRARDSEEVREGLEAFLLQRLLFWMEVLNLKKCMGEGPSILSQAQSWLSVNNTPGNTVRYTTDAHIFATQFAGSAGSQSTPHLYLSAFAFCSKLNSVYHHYWHPIKGVRDVNGTMMNQREQAALAVWSAGSVVNSAAFSPDGTRIVSGSGDNTIRVWNTLTGEPVGRPFEGHTDWVGSVAFSPDGTRIVSGSGDNTIRVWNTLTGEPVGRPFEGHTEWVRSVAFSPDGTRIVSGSGDKTIRVWNTLTGEPVGRPFEGHTNTVRSVAFSPDGTRIVSGSGDNTIRVWNILTGEPVGRPFEGHTNTVRSVAFSPDGTRIVSGSDDKTIRVWNTLTGEPVGRPFEGYTNTVRSVAFSPDGTRIVSGSGDNTIRVWNTLTGEPVGRPFEGHTEWVDSVAFSPDGTRIVSGSHDNTIRVWNTLTGEPVGHPFEGETSDGSVEFPPTQNQHDYFNDQWTLKPDGWITTTDNVLLFWTPLDLHRYLSHPSAKLVIAPKGTISVDYSDIVFGDRWAECWRSE